MAPEFDGKPFKSVTQGAADLSEIPLLDTGTKPDAEISSEIATFLAFVKTTLGDEISDVKASDRLTESAVCLVAPEHGPDRQFERLLNAAGRLDKAAKPILEINPRHERVAALAKLGKEESAFKEDDWPVDVRPEIAFLGRSNVGKSSLINSLLATRGLARTSSTPGRTQSLNFFLISERFWFVDLPGFGYAKVPKNIKSTWGEMATSYLAKRSQLVLSIQIVDSRHEPTKLDLQLHEWLQHNEKPLLTVATKSDKLSNNELRKNLERIARALNDDSVVAYSAKTGRGRDEIWRAITNAIV